MPTYNFEHKTTGEVQELHLSMSEREEWLDNNPDWKQIITSVNIVSGVMGQGSLKSDGGWRDNLSRIAEAHPNSPLADRYGKKSIKEVKTKQVIEKHRKRQRGK